MGNDDPNLVGVEPDVRSRARRVPRWWYEHARVKVEEYVAKHGQVALARAMSPADRDPPFSHAVVSKFLQENPTFSTEVVSAVAAFFDMPMPEYVPGSYREAERLHRKRRDRDDDGDLDERREDLKRDVASTLEKKRGLASNQSQPRPIRSDKHGGREGKPEADGLAPRRPEPRGS